MAMVPETEITKIKNFAERFSKKTKVTEIKKIKPLTKTEIKNIEKFIDTYGLDNLKGLDRRIKIAKVLGIRKTSKLIKPLEETFTQIRKPQKFIKTPKEPKLPQIVTKKNLAKFKSDLKKFQIKKIKLQN
jgi:ribosomal protein S13